MLAIVPPSLTNQSLDVVEIVETDPGMIWPVRITLLAFAVVFAVVLVIAVRLNPYQGGQTLTQATHRQLGLPACSFYSMTGIPCPSCGMTTSFALLVRGDVISSMRANWVGTSLATFCALFIPWSVASVVRRRALFIASIEITLTRLILAFLWLLLARWCVVILLLWHNGLLQKP